MKIVERPISSLRPYDGNARIHPDDQIELIERSIREFGWTVPVLIAEDGEVVAGHGRIEAAKNLGIEVVPTIEVGHLTPAQIKAYRIADNRIAELGQWDLGLMTQDLEILADAGFDLSLTGFDDEFLDAVSIDEEVFDNEDTDPHNPVLHTDPRKAKPKVVVWLDTEETLQVFLEAVEASGIPHTQNRRFNTVTIVSPPDPHFRKVRTK